MIRALFTAALLLAAPVRAEIAIQEVTSPGGIKAWLVEDHNIPFTALELQFKGGSSLEAPDKRGVVNLMTATLEEGAGEMDSKAFAEARDALAAGISFDSGADSVGVSAKFLTENRDQAIELMRAALVNPRFDQDAVDRVREQVLSNLRANEKDPGTHCVREVRRFGLRRPSLCDDRGRDHRDGNEADPRRRGGGAQGGAGAGPGLRRGERRHHGGGAGQALGPAAGRPAGDRRAAAGHRALASAAGGDGGRFPDAAVDGVLRAAGHPAR
jgi:hypothetical protein